LPTSSACRPARANDSEALFISTDEVRAAASTALSTRASQVAALAVEQENGSPTVLSIQVVPRKPVHVHHVGVVTGFLGGVSITIKDKDTELNTFRIGEALSPGRNELVR